jgi:hypothetical protein
MAPLANFRQEVVLLYSEWVLTQNHILYPTQCGLNWFETTSFGARTLLVYVGYWNQDAVMILSLNNGAPELVYSSGHKLLNNDVQLNDGLWHYIPCLTVKFPKLNYL